MKKFANWGQVTRGSIAFAAILVGAVCLAGNAVANGSDVVADAAPSPSPESSLVQTVVNQVGSLDPIQTGPVFIEFAGSATLSAKLIEAARAGGFDVVDDAFKAKTVLRIVGELSLVGGPKFYRGIKFPLGEVTEKALASHDGKRGATAGEVGGAVMLSLGTQLATSALGVGFGVSNLAVIIGDMTGVRGWMNTKLTGDPRGWCLSRCADWNKVLQTAELKISWETDGNRQSATVSSKAFAEALVPDALVNAALSPVFGMFLIQGPSTRVALASHN